MKEKIIHTNGKNLLLQPVSKGHELLPLSEIRQINGYGRYCSIVLQNDKKIRSYRPLRYYESLLDGHQFFRVSRNNIVNLSHIRRIGQTGVLLTNGEKLLLSRRMRACLLRELKKL